MEKGKTDKAGIKPKKRVVKKGAKKSASDPSLLNSAMRGAHTPPFGVEEK